MWRIYSVHYMKHNKAAGIFIMASALLASMLLSFLSVFFYNLWMDQKYQLFLQTGSVDEAVTPLIVAYLFILIIASTSLILMLHNAFEVTMNARMHQLGILQSVGATPAQIKSVLVSEAVVLSLVPLAVGTLAGVGLSYGVWKFFYVIGDSFREYDLWFRYRPALSAGAIVFSYLTVRLSAWIPARKLSLISPLEAIQYGTEAPVERMRQFRIFSALFGCCGELARKSIYARRKAFRTTTLSLGLSFFAFISFLNLETISGIFTEDTYFNQYRDKWDFLLSIDEREGADSGLTDEITKIEGVKSCLTYRRFKAQAALPEELFSSQLKETGIGNLNDQIIKSDDGNYLVDIPVYVLDHESFAEYYGNTADPALAQQQAVAVNLIWDSVNSGWRNKTYIPFLKEDHPVTLELKDGSGENSGIPVTIALFTETLPDWKEQLQQYALTLVISEHDYEKLKKQFPARSVYFNIKTVSEQKHDEVLSDIRTLLTGKTHYTLDSRLEEERTERIKRDGLRLFMGFLAVLFSSIGLSNVFSVALGQIYQRKKEFARYMSVGLSYRGVKKILLTESLIITLNPLLFSLLVNIPLVMMAVNASGISLTDYLKKAPVVPVLMFTAFVMFFVGLAYTVGAMKICKGNLMDLLKDDTMV
ncbi:putative ABC transport system permease protein [Hungatella effluvii]|uniref:Putative ABC transport system permease protein n=1 Tax=Hungatella effluvii TaxID=1096246 RepID=A0A2V3YSG6_9FIRM|nr:ABC transporter permease [Hungatella effluvii]PXX57304.1 putative ABC transport system permease protein [Hungatella effluvii]